MKDFDKDFFEWLDKKYPMEGHNDWLFEDLPKSAQFGLVQEFADTFKVYIEAYGDTGWEIEGSLGNHESLSCDMPRQEAQDKAIEKLKELYNQKQ